MQGKSKKIHKETKQKPGLHKAVEQTGFYESVPLWVIAAVLVFTAVLYSKALFNGFAWDDEGYILKNPFIKSFTLHNIKAIFTSFYFGNYHPLTTLTYLLEYSLFGLNPVPYHLLNILIHLVNVWLVFKFIEKISDNRLAALIVSLLFAIHPLHVESVAWISERKDVLYTLFYFLSLLFYLKYIKSGYRLKNYFGAIILFVASLLSKPAAVTLPVLLVVIDWYKGRKINTRSLLEKAPFLLLSLLFGILTIFSQQAKMDNLPLPYSFFDRIFLLTYIISFYLIKAIAPFNLSAVHYYPDTHGGSLPAIYFLSLPFLIFLVVLIIKRRTFRKEILFSFIFFLVTISVMLQIIPVGSSIASERYTYVPYIGLFYLAGQWISAKIQQRKIILAILSVFILLFSYQTWARIGVWKDTEVLFTDVIKRNPEIGHGYWIRGNVRRDKGNLRGALMDYDKTLEYKKGFVPCLINRGDVYNKLNNYNQALNDLTLAINTDSTYAEAYVNRAIAYEGTGNMSLALADYNRAILLSPEFAFAYNNRSILKVKTGDVNGALDDINKVISLTPGDAKAYSNRGNMKAAFLKDYKGSIEDFTYSLKLKTDDGSVYFNRGLSYLNFKDTAAACLDWKKARNLGDPDAGDRIKQYCEKN